MTERTGRIGLFIFFLLFIFALIWIYTEKIDLLRQIDNNSKTILVDTSLFYVLLGSILIPVVVLDFIQIWKFKEIIYKYFGTVIVVWFILSIILAGFILPTWLESHIEDKGYLLCATRERAVMTRGYEAIYQLPPCDYELLKSEFDVGTVRPWEPVTYEFK